ncbi:SPASM domain-containing protein [Desulfovibrio sp. OttesenSCG-928-A18]|nr:SPASM domain-containing protein [Desulfovibrio sp. OttesenSCG-928-A18]
MRVPSFFIIPSLACQASCKYCFGPHRGAIMDERTARESIRFIRGITEETGDKDISITFHGGEPLLAPLPVWRALFDEVQALRADCQLGLSLQSNLWNLTDEFLELFAENHVSIGTSLDGPQEFCDLTRGEGYFAKTWASVRKANAAGCSVGAIATIAKATLPHTREIGSFFRNNGMSLMLHGALGSMHDPENDLALTASDYADMIKDWYSWYIPNRTSIKIDTLDHFARGMVIGKADVCTMRDCLGMFLAISPTGEITSCQRLAGKKEFSLGNIFDSPPLALLYDSPAARRQLEREQQVARRCADCEFYPVCKGGCYYNALASGDGVLDPLCEAYKDIYTFVRDKVLQEMQSPENIQAVTAHPAEPHEHPLLRKGAYISLAGAAHPTHIADNARRVLAIHELGRTKDPHVAAQRLFKRKVCGDPALTETLLKTMQQGMSDKRKSRNNCYIHATLACNLRCKHCYAEAGSSGDEISLAGFESLVGQAINGRFRQIVITGGEPLVHTQRQGFMEVCAARKGRGTNLVLRTNLTGEFSDSDLSALAKAFDQVVVSVDGNEQTHNARRGAGTYGNMVRNLEKYARVASTVRGAAELSLACVMSADDVNGEPGHSVKLLGERLMVKRVRFRPLLPIGRAAHLDEPVICEGLMQHVSPEDMLKSECRPLTTCGIGQNLFVKPDGKAYPCYAWCGEHTYIGDIFADGLEAVLASPGYLRLMNCSVDTIEQCRDCEFRYLCGGACRAWGNQTVLDVNAAPPHCEHLKARAERLIVVAMEYLPSA